MKIQTRMPRQPQFGPAPSRPMAGFTLIELMVVVAIAGILAALAYPSFMSQIRKSRRSDAVHATLAVQQAQERWRSNNPTYASTLTSLGLSSTSTEGYYAITLTSVASTLRTTYTVTASAVAGKSQVNDTGCSSLAVVVNSGTPTRSQPTCWSR